MLTNWKGLKTGKILPLEKEANQFQYVHHMHFEHDVIMAGAGAKMGDGDWHIQLISPSETVLFEQKVRIKILVITVGYVLVQLYTWMFSSEQIETTIIGGSPITEDNPAWSHTIGGTEFSEFGTLFPGGGAGQTNLTATIDTSWESPVYIMRLPVGTRLNVIKDSWGLGVSTRPEYQFRFNLIDTDLVDANYGQFNELFTVKSRGADTTLIFGMSREDYQFDWKGYIKDCWDPCMISMPDGRIILGVSKETGFWEYESKDYGRSFNPILYPDSNGVLVERPLVEAGVQMPSMISIDDTRVIITARGNTILRTIVDENGYTSTISIGSVIGTKSYALAKNDSGKLEIVDNSGRVRFTSSDKGMYFEKKVYDDEDENEEIVE